MGARIGGVTPQIQHWQILEDSRGNYLRWPRRGVVMRYWDTSVLLKVFVEEHDSALFTALVEESGAVIHTSELSRLELLRALWSKRLEGAIRRGAEERLMHRFE